MEDILFLWSEGKMELKHPFTALVCGPTKAGKTVLVKNLVLHAQSMMKPPPKTIYWCYTDWQSLYDDLTHHVTFVDGMPESTLDLKQNTDEPKLLIFDDLMQQMKKQELAQLFTKGCHHWNLSCIH